MNVQPTLCLLGGRPAFSEPLHVGGPNLGSRERLFELIGEALDTRRISNNGPLVQLLERRLAALHGVKHCVAACNGTLALQLTLRAAGLTGEVIVPAFTFVATAHALAWERLTPVFCDVDPKTHNLDPGSVETLITPRTSAILGVHCWGRPCDVPALEAIAKRHGLALIFDAASAVGCSHRGSMLGGNGRAEILSLHATKCAHAGEGGAILTNDAPLAAQLALMRNFGFDGYDHVACLGTNGKMSEIAAALGLTGLDALERIVRTNRGNYSLYREVLRDSPGLSLLPYSAAESQNYHYVVAEVATDCALNRDQLIDVLLAENVLARRYFYPGCHRLEPYRTSFERSGRQLHCTDELVQRVLVLPNGETVNEHAIRTIGRLIDAALTNAAAVRQQLEARRAAAASSP